MLQRIMILAVSLVLAGAADAQIRGLKKYTNEYEGFSLGVPKKWDAIPPQPDELDTMMKWSSKRGTRGMLWELEVMRFVRKGGVTASGETPASVGDEKEKEEDEKEVSTAERIRRFQESMRPESFKAYMKRSYRTDLEEPVREVKVGSSTMKIYALPSIGRGFSMLAGVLHDGTYEWAVIYTGPADELVETDKPSKSTKDGASALKSMKTLRFFEPKERESNANMTEFDRKIDQVRRKLPKSWKVIPTKKKQYVVVHNIPEKKTRQLVFVTNILKYLEHIRKQYEVLFPPKQEITAVSVVRVCAGRDEYFKYGGPRGSAGYWNFVDEELVIYDASGEGGGGGVGDSYSTLFHEAFHQYIFYAVGQVSPHSWYNEGYGDYFAGANPKNRFKIEPFAWRVPVVKQAASEGKLVPLEKLVYYTQAQYYSNPSVCYAQGWAFIYFLNNARAVRDNEAWGKILDIYFAECVKSGDLKKAVELAFAEVDFDELQEAYEKFIKTDFRQ